MVLGDVHGVRATQIQPPLLLSVEAIIGAGKSTLLEQLDSCNEIVVVREPVALWEQQRGTETLLSRYYGDQKSNCFMFETYAMMSRVKALSDARNKISPETRAIVMERSWLSSRHCFGENSKELGHLDELEASLYEDIFQWGSETWPKLDGVIFIDVDLEVAQSRVAARGRTAESGIPSDYQMALINKHRQWLFGEGSGAFDGPVLTLDGNQDKSNGALDNFMASVTRFIDGMYTAPNTPPSGPRKHLSDKSVPATQQLQGYPKVTLSLADMVSGKKEEAGKREGAPPISMQFCTRSKLRSSAKLFQSVMPACGVSEVFQESADNDKENSGNDLVPPPGLDEIVTPVKQKKPQDAVMH